MFVIGRVRERERGIDKRAISQFEEEAFCGHLTTCHLSIYRFKLITTQSGKNGKTCKIFIASALSFIIRFSNAVNAFFLLLLWKEREHESRRKREHVKGFNLNYQLQY